MALVAAAIDVLINILLFCWKVFYWGSFTAMMMVFAGCVFGGYYLFKEKHPRDYWKVTASSNEGICLFVVVVLIALVPLVNAFGVWFLFTEHESIVHETIKKIEVKHGFTEPDIA